MATGVELVREGGASALTTRACAERNGVASSAVFRHFRDRRALLTTVATEGFAMLARGTITAYPELEPRDRLLAIGGAYLCFAMEEPKIVRLMFSDDILDMTDTDLKAAAEPILEQTAIAAGAGGDLSDPRTLLAWSIVHGLATLAIDNQLATLVPAEPADRAKRFEGILRFALPLFMEKNSATGTGEFVAYDDESNF